MQPTLFDAFLGLALIGTILSACHRGLGKEMLHTIMFIVMVAVGIIFISDTQVPASPEDLAKFTTSCAFYLAAIYVFMWGGMGVVGPLVLGREMVGLRSRFWAGALSITKLLVAILGLNLWFAVHSPYGHPLRLEAFPTVVKHSILVNFFDRKTDVIYRMLAEKGYLDYTKIQEKPKTEEELKQTTVQDLMELRGDTVEPRAEGDGAAAQ